MNVEPGNGQKRSAPLAGEEPAYCPVWSDECYQRGFWYDGILFDEVVAQADRRPSKVAVADKRGVFRYGELVRETMAIAAALHQVGVEKGDVVLVAMPPMREFVPVFLAVERLGAIVANVLPSLGEHELGRILALSRPKAAFTVDGYRSHRSAEVLRDVITYGKHRCRLVVAGDGSLPAAPDGGAAPGVVAYDDFVEPMRAAAHVERLPDPPASSDLANLAFTTGSTSEPKGVLHTHNTSLVAVRSTAARQELGEDDVFHAVLPVGHTYGYFYGVRLALAAGGQVIMQQTWDPEEMLSLAEQWKITHSAGTPTHLSDILTAGSTLRRALASLRIFTCAGAPLDASLAAEASERMPGRLSVAYGMSEAGHIASTGSEADPSKMQASCGRVHPETALWVDRTASQDGGVSGEIVIRGPSVFAGYLQNVDPGVRERQRDGTYRTGDLGYLDADGYLVLTGRQTELVVRGGEKIPVGTLEHVLRNHPAIGDVVITGVPDLRLGERCVAVVEAQAASDIQLADVIGYLKDQGITRAFWPESVVTVKELPRNDVGKWVRSSVRRLACERLGVDPDDTRAQMPAGEGGER